MRHFAIFISIFTFSLVCSTICAQESQKTIVLLKISGKNGKAATKTLFKQFESNPDYLMFDDKWFFDRASELGFTSKDFYKDPISLYEVCKEFRIDIVIGGNIKKKKKKYYLNLNIYDGATGESMGESSHRLKKKKVTKKIAKQAINEMQEHISFGGWDTKETSDEMSFEPENKDPVIIPEIIEPEIIEPEHPNTNPIYGPSRYVISGSVGLTVNFRSMDLLGQPGFVINYQSSPYPGFDLRIKALPLALLGKAKWYTEWGISFGARVNKVNTKLIEDGEEPDAKDIETELDTSHTEMDINLFYRFHLGDTLEGLFIDLNLGYRTVKFTLQENKVYNSSEYSGFNLGLEAEFPIKLREADSFNFLSLGGGFRLMPGSYMGDSVAEYGTNASCLGIGFDVFASLHIYKGLFFSIKYSLEYYSAEYEGLGIKENDEAKNWEGATSTDLFQHIGFLIGYRY